MCLNAEGQNLTSHRHEMVRATPEPATTSAPTTPPLRATRVVEPAGTETPPALGFIICGFAVALVGWRCRREPFALTSLGLIVPTAEVGHCHVQFALETDGFMLAISSDIPPTPTPLPAPGSTAVDVIV